NNGEKSGGVMKRIFAGPKSSVQPGRGPVRGSRWRRQGTRTGGCQSACACLSGTRGGHLPRRGREAPGPRPAAADARVVPAVVTLPRRDDPDLMFERHSQFAFGHVDGVSIRVYHADGTLIEAFRELCRIQKRLDDYPILNEQDYGQREYEAT